MRTASCVRLSCVSFGIACALTLTSAPSRAQSASFTGLGDLPGGEGDFWSLAWDLGAGGSVVIGYGESGEDATGDSIYEAFLWTPTLGLVGLGFVPGGDYQFSEAIGVSNAGDVIVGQSTSADAVTSEAFRWTPSTGMVGLGFLPGGSAQSWGYGVSPDGSVVVGFSMSSIGIQAFRWTELDGMTGLGDLPGGDSFSRAWDASHGGEVIVGLSDSAASRYFEAFRWTAAEGMVGLGDLPGGLFESEAYAVSEDGKVIVGAGTSALGEEAFRWTAATGMVGLGDLSGGEFESEAWGVSADGSIIVGAGHTERGEEAFLWDAEHGMRRLQSVLEQDHGLDLGTWQLEAARRVADAGRVVIVGSGINPLGKREGWRAVLPQRTHAAGNSRPLR
jgi:probable HAF family extracellular repeat protein